MLSFYSFLIGISNEAEKLQKADSLSEFTGIHFSRLDSTDRLNIEYLFISSRIWPDPKTKLITLPGAFTRRDIVQQAIDNINASDGHVHVLRGRRLSGKTYALVDLLMEFQSRNTYYFPSSKSISKVYALLRTLNSGSISALPPTPRTNPTMTTLRPRSTRSRRRYSDNTATTTHSDITKRSSHIISLRQSSSPSLL